MTTPFRSDDITVKLAFIGGAASTLADLAYLVRDLKHDPALREKQVELTVFDPAGLNEGPAYRVNNPAFYLNQPAGKEMDPFHEGGPGLPQSFLAFLQETYPEKNYKADDFVARGLYGEYLRYVRDWIVAEAASSPNVTLNVVKEKIVDVDVAGTKSDGTPNLFRLIDDKGNGTVVDGFVNAQGHIYEPRLQNNPNYIAAYDGLDFEARLTKLALTSTKDLVITFMGSGASMIDIVCALEQSGYKGTYRAISPYGNSCWPYNPHADKPTGAGETRLQELVGIFAASDNALKKPAQALRAIIDAAGREGIAPHFVLGTALKNDLIKNDETLLRAVKAFYGNPLSPDRFALVEKLSSHGNGTPPRLQFETNRIGHLEAGRDGRVSIDLFDGAAFETLHGPLIDCTVVQRGIRYSSGAIAQPVIAKQLELKLTGEVDGALAVSSPRGLPIWSNGPVTNAFKNGIETFCPSYKLVSQQIAGFIRNWTPSQAAQPALRSELRA